MGKCNWSVEIPTNQTLTTLTGLCSSQRVLVSFNLGVRVVATAATEESLPWVPDQFRYAVRVAAKARMQKLVAQHGSRAGKSLRKVYRATPSGERALKAITATLA